MQKPKTAKYLLRFDDICPTMDWQKWWEIEALLLERGLSPILAVIPNNQDPTLRYSPPADDFWDRVRQWQTRGWPIALHGHEHKYVSSHAGIVGTRKKSEFAGLPAEVQREKLQRGLSIFREQGINPQLWIAPGHSFDHVTVSVLSQVGIRIICDGHFWFPYVCSKRMVWVPQQLFYFRPAPRGIWTVCYHHNQWDEARLARFHEEINCYERDICSLAQALRWYGSRESRWSERFCTSPHVSQFVVRCQLKLWSYWSPWASRERVAARVPIKPSLKPQ